MNDVPWTVAAKAWNADGLGNHRAILRVSEAADACVVEVPWRRRDPYVGEMAVRLFESVSGREVTNLVPLKITRDCGAFAFQASVAGEYQLYYMPCVMPALSTTEYLRADYSKADATWVARHGLGGASASVPAGAARRRSWRFRLALSSAVSIRWKLSRAWRRWRGCWRPIETSRLSPSLRTVVSRCG